MRLQDEMATHLDHPGCEVSVFKKVLHGPCEIRCRAHRQQRRAGEHAVPVPHLLIVSGRDKIRVREIAWPKCGFEATL